MTGPVLCHGCGSTLESLHPWDTRTCRCGTLTVGGGRRRFWLRWTAVSGAGWSEVGTDEEAPPSDRRLGYAPGPRG